MFKINNYIYIFFFIISNIYNISAFKWTVISHNKHCSSSGLCITGGWNLGKFATDLEGRSHD